MVSSMLLFETDFVNIVAIAFTATILNELVMVSCSHNLSAEFLLTVSLGCCRSDHLASLDGGSRDRQLHLVCCQHGFLTSVFRCASFFGFVRIPL